MSETNGPRVDVCVCGHLRSEHMLGGGFCGNKRGECYTNPEQKEYAMRVHGMPDKPVCERFVPASVGAPDTSRADLAARLEDLGRRVFVSQTEQLSSEDLGLLGEAAAALRDTAPTDDAPSFPCADCRKRRATTTRRGQHTTFSLCDTCGETWDRVTEQQKRAAPSPQVRDHANE